MSVTRPSSASTWSRRESELVTVRPAQDQDIGLGLDQDLDPDQELDLIWTRTGPELDQD